MCNKSYLIIALCVGLITSARSVGATADSGKHLFILSGQSNMAGMNPDVSFTPTVTEAFGKDKVIIVKDAHGGQSIRNWSKTNHEFPPPTTGQVPKERGKLYDLLMTKVKAAIQGQSLESVTFVWMQGESDLSTRHTTPT